MTMNQGSLIWVFSGEEGILPSGVFLDLGAAEQWIATNSLTGILTAYPADYGVYDWAIEKGFFRPSKEYQKTPKFIGRFNSANLQHFHFENGKRWADSSSPIGFSEFEHEDITHY